MNTLSDGKTPDEPNTTHKTASVRSRLIRTLFGDDVFISYSRADQGAKYAADLAVALAKRRYLCRFDQWASKPGPLPDELLRALDRSSMLVVVATAGAAQSEPIETEINRFLPTGRRIVAIDVDGTIGVARWWPQLKGLAVSVDPGGPSEAVVERIEKTITFTRRTTLLTRLAIGALAIFVALSALSVGAAWWAADAVLRAGSETTRANEASKKAQRADREREEAEKRRQQALTDLANTEIFLKEEKAVAESRKLAWAWLTSVRPLGRVERSLVAAMQAVATSPTPEAIDTLRAALDEAMRRTGPSPIAISRDGKHAAVASRFGGGLVTDFRHAAHSLCGSAEPIQALSFSPDGRFLVLARWDHDIDGQRDASPSSPGREAWTYELWDTASNRRLTSTILNHSKKDLFNSLVAFGRALARIEWAPDSTLFIAVGLQGEAYRVQIAPGMKLRVTPIDWAAHTENIAFAEQSRRFVTWPGPHITATNGDYPINTNTGEVTIWDYDGKKLWSQSFGDVDWVGFRNKGQRLIVKDLKLRYDPDGRDLNVKESDFVVVDFDQTGGVTRDDRIAVSQFDHSLLNGGVAPRSCSSRFTPAIRDSIRPRELCQEGTSSPIVFDSAVRRNVATLTRWNGDEVRDGVFGKDGSLFVLGKRSLSAWSIDGAGSASLRWARDTEPYSSPDLSSDDKHLLVVGQHEAVAIDTRTGGELRRLPTGKYLGWRNEDGSQAISVIGLEDSEVNKNERRIVLWRTDTGGSVRKVSLSVEDSAELAEVQALLKSPAPSPDSLLSAANRRLRQCQTVSAQ